MEVDTATNLPEHLHCYEDVIQSLRRTGELFWQRGWNRGFHGSYSVVVKTSPKELLVSAGGKDIGRLQTTDFVLVDAQGNPVHANQASPAVDCPMHCLLAEEDSVGAVLHTQSIWTTLLSMRFLALKGVLLEGFHTLRGLSETVSHEHSEWLPIISHGNETEAFLTQTRKTIHQSERPVHGLLIHQNGLYTWGRDLEEAVRRTETLEFLCEVLARQMRI